MDVVRRAVERIDEPHVVVLSDLDLRSFLFTNEQMMGKAGRNFRPNRRLRRQIGVGHQVGGRLLARLKAAPPGNELARARPGR